jgi:MFS family permease
MTHSTHSLPTPPELDDDLEGMTVAASLNGETLRQLLRNRNFVPLWLGQMVSYIGDQFTLIAALSVVQALAGKEYALWVALIGVANAAPTILLGLIGGVLVDRLDRKWVMIATDVIRAVALLSLLFVGNDASRLWLFVVALFVTGAAGTLFYPARASALPAIVSRQTLATANALIEAGFVIALVLGSLLSTTLIAAVGAGAAFAFNGGAYLFSALMILIMQIPQRVIFRESEASIKEVWAELRDGLSYMWRTRSMRYIMGLSIMVATSIGAVLILALEYLNSGLNVGQGAYGPVIAILGIGIVIGGVLIKQLSRFLPTNRLVGAAMALNGLAVLGFVLNPSYLVVCIFTALIGFSVVVARAVLGTLVQAIPPEEYRGRVQGAFNLIFSAPLAISVGMAGVLLSLFKGAEWFNFSWLGIELSPELGIVGTAGQEWIVFAGFGVALLLTAVLAVVMLRGIDEAVYSSDEPIEGASE